MIGENWENVKIVKIFRRGLTKQVQLCYITIMAEDMRSDEELIIEWRTGDNKALEQLFARYLIPLKQHITTVSWFFDNDHLDEVLQIIMITLFETLRSGKFIPSGQGSFKAWAFHVAENISHSQNRRRTRQTKIISSLYPEESTGIDEDIILELPPETTDYEEIEERVSELRGKLTPEEQKLMELVSVNTKYKDILNDPMFNKYSLDSLKHKICNIRKKLLKARRNTL